MTTSSNHIIDSEGQFELAQASHAFLTEVPLVSLADAALLAKQGFGMVGNIQTLSGERDRNFLLRPAQAELGAVTLKFINAAELPQETDMQIQVLKHLEGRCTVPVPVHIRPLTSTADWLDWFTAAGQPLRVRCYSFLEGKPASELARHPTAWRALGEATAQLHQALIDFEHPAASREFLWDARRAPLLRSWLEVVESEQRRTLISAFWSTYEKRLHRFAKDLPLQVIHNDLSPSNLLTSADGQAIAGVLDFGDMLHAPRVVDLAISASYQMALTDTPSAALQPLLDGYQSLLPLHAVEHEMLLDFILARLTQRMVITAWRARCYPDNSAYILRSQATATALFDHLIDAWLQQHSRN